MKKNINPAACVGMLFVLTVIIYNRFVEPIPDLIAVPISLAALLLMLSGFGRLIFYPVKTGMLTDNVYAVRTGFVNLYVFNAGGKYLVFDSGINPAFSGKGLQKLGISPDLVSHVFLTHSDYDHAGGLGLFKNAKVYLSEKEEPMITGKQGRFLFFPNKRIYDYHLLKDREVINAGSAEVMAISTPGHTPGSMCYLVNGEILVVGDTLRISHDREFTPFLFLQNKDHERNRLSLKMLENEGFLQKSKLILSGHTGIVK